MPIRRQLNVHSESGETAWAQSLILDRMDDLRGRTGSTVPSVFTHLPVSSNNSSDHMSIHRIGERG